MFPDEFQASVLSELRLIRTLLEKKNSQTPNDDADLELLPLRFRPESVHLAPYEDPHEVPGFAFEDADAVRYVVGLEPILKKSAQGTYDWKTANQAARRFMDGKNFGYLQNLKDWALAQPQFKGRLIVSPIMFEFLERQFDDSLPLR